MNKGVKAYAVRRAKRGEAMWRVEITYRGMTMELRMSYDERDGVLRKHSKTGEIEVIYKDVGARGAGKRVELDLGLLAAIREGQLAVIKERCKNRDN
ncbi:MAG: hypothetical protein JZD41_05955, partial [Thermoproteus sp.]|nr:hypothetical protein [Thermoproteus sp.]